jgi:hypothetical protein
MANGWHFAETILYPDGRSERVLLQGPFETRNEALLVGLGFDTGLGILGGPHPRSAAEAMTEGPPAND